jgi:hypothetical protein
MEGRKAFGRLFASTQSLQAIAVVQRAIRGREPAGMMRELAFGPLVQMSNFAVSMSGGCACMVLSRAARHLLLSPLLFCLGLCQLTHSLPGRLNPQPSMLQGAEPASRPMSSGSPRRMR